jgi:guanine deaminase
MSASELLRATLFHTPADALSTPGALRAHADGGLLIRDGRVIAAGDYDIVRTLDPGAVTTDWRGGFVIPGLVDTHIHFPQVRIIGHLGRSLLDWLGSTALPEEARMSELRYARDTARRFVRLLAAHGTTTALVFGAHYAPATAALFEEAAARGLRMVSGLVLSDRRLRPELHQSPDQAYRDATGLIKQFHGKGRLLYAVTPRFALSTSEAMLEMCQTLHREHDGLRVQSHVNENLDEIAEVRRLFPWAADYMSVYERYGLDGAGAVMAHDVWPTDGELERLAGRKTSVAHCPCSNAALGSGIFPFRRHLAAGVHCSLGTDVGGGTGFGMLKEALQAYLMQRVAPEGLPLDASQLLYLATRAGATALGLDGDIGDFQAGKAADLVYLRPEPGSALAAAVEASEDLHQTLAALITLGDAGCIRDVRVEGASIYQTVGAS